MLTVYFTLQAQAFFYQSNCKEPGVIGIMEVSPWHAYPRNAGLALCMIRQGQSGCAMTSCFMLNFNRWFVRHTLTTLPGRWEGSTMTQEAHQRNRAGSWSTASW